MDNVVRLTVPPKDGDEDVESKTYSLDELKDLQSKLMLIAGKAEKGKDEVERFVKVSIMKMIDGSVLGIPLHSHFSVHCFDSCHL